MSIVIITLVINDSKFFNLFVCFIERHKLDWARGSQSDSLAILNAFKVQYVMKTSWVEFTHWH